MLVSRDAVIIGAGGHARVVVSILLDLGAHNIRGIFDLGTPGSDDSIMGIPVVGNAHSLKDTNHSGGVDYFLAIGSNSIRRHWFSELRKLNFNLPNLISPHAIVDASASLGHANVICARAFIGPETTIGSNNLFNTGSIIDHEAKIGNHCHFAPASVIAGRVVVGDECFLGAGATILDGVNVASRVTMGGGALINKDIETSDCVYVGVPGRPLIKELV